MHHLVRNKLEKMSEDEINAAKEVKRPWSCAIEPIRKDVQNIYPESEIRESPYIVTCPVLKSKPLNQGEMAGTLICFYGLALLHPKEFGIHDASDEDLEAFCHFWAGLGYLLGIEDE